MIHRRFVLLALKFLVAIAALSYVIYIVDWNRSINLLQHADLRWLSLGYSLSLVSLFVAALRWTILLRAVNQIFNVISAYRAYLTGTFYSLAMPGVIGGDVARVWLCYREIDASVSLVTATVLLERALGVLTLLILLNVGITFFPIVNSGLGLGIAPFLAGAGLFGVFVLPSLLRRFARDEGRQDGYGNSRIIKAFSLLIKELVPIKSVRVVHLLVALLLSVIFQLLDIAVTYSIAQALSIKLTASMLLVAMPIVYLVTVLPISPGGLGVREGALVFVLAQFGISAADAALLALTVFVNRAAVGILGGLLHLAGGSRIGTFRKKEI
ncbi:lysylphosphatidylglycerol synthase transmembrane domain-containing protein [Methylotuvimicrobium sp.]|uniref:lysylphosphatidylglycerol synthase transmembrane domain-containing protein n=1 Tax=Methylotuvimicrobium sp. TaxID=2822413 RepID=UPI003D646505